MLPDYVEVKRTLRRRLDAAFRRQLDELTVIGRLARRQRMHEGNSLLTKREDGSEERTDLTEASARFEIDTTDPEDFSPRAVWEKLRGAAEEMASIQSASAIEAIHSAVASSGNVFDARGRPMSAELWLEALELVPLDFDLTQQPILPILVVHPSRSDVLRDELRRIDEEPVLARRFRDLVDRKRDEWRARESDRKLVD